MGTTFTIDVRDPGDWSGPIAEVVAWLHRVDALFSTYRTDSEISRIRRGELTVPAASPDVREVMALASELETETDGFFSATWDGGLDPTGLVKGWAIERASELLTRSGAREHGINGGGDMQLAGDEWRVGISDPHDPSRLLTVVEGSDFALATSGTAACGAHIVDPRTGNSPAALVAVTVLGSHLGRVDAYATAAFAMEDAALEWLEAQPGVEGLVVARDGTTAATSGFYASGSAMTKVAPPPGVGSAVTAP